MQDGTLGKPDKSTDTEGEEMNINIDSPTTIHQYPAVAETAPSPAPPAVASAPKQSLLAKVFPYLVAGALGASGVGLPWAVAALTAKPAAATVDADTHYILELVPNE